MEERMKSADQKSLKNDQVKVDDLALKPQWKIYLGMIWGFVCIGLFSIKPILGIIAPFLYVIYLFMDTKFDYCCIKLFKKFKAIVTDRNH